MRPFGPIRVFFCLTRNILLCPRKQRFILLVAT